MFAIRRKALQSARGLPAAAGRVRQYSADHSDEKTGGHDGHGYHSKAVDESLGTQFYVVLAAIPLSIGAYTFSRPGADGKITGISKMISDTYTGYKDEWVDVNTRHTAAIEDAAMQRNLFQSSRGSAHVDLRFPEIFNTGSPWNVSAGQGPRSMDTLVAHYEKINAEEQEKRIKKLAAKEGRS